MERRRRAPFGHVRETSRGPGGAHNRLDGADIVLRGLSLHRIVNQGGTGRDSEQRSGEPVAAIHKTLLVSFLWQWEWQRAQKLGSSPGSPPIWKRPRTGTKEKGREACRAGSGKDGKKQ